MSLLTAQAIAEKITWREENLAASDDWTDYVTLNSNVDEMPLSPGEIPRFYVYDVELRLGQRITLDRRMRNAEPDVRINMARGIHHTLYSAITDRLHKLAYRVGSGSLTRDETHRAIVDLIKEIDA